MITFDKMDYYPNPNDCPNNCYNLWKKFDVELIKEYGADSLRYSLVTGVTPGQDIPLNMDKIAANRQFANKLWNICKFVTENALKNAFKNAFKMAKILKIGN